MSCCSLSIKDYLLFVKNFSSTYFDMILILTLIILNFRYNAHSALRFSPPAPNISEMPRTLPQCQNMSGQNSPCTRDLQYHAAHLHNPTAASPSPPDRCAKFSSYFSYSTDPYQEYNHNCYNRFSLSEQLFSLCRKSHASPAPPWPADTPDFPLRSIFPPYW